MQNFFQKKEWNTDTDTIFFIFYMIVILSITAIYFLFQILPEKWVEILGCCPFHEATGLYCPGCGGTRAIIALAHLHPLLSLYYHPIPLYGAILGLFFLPGRFVAALSKGKYNYFHAHCIFLWIALILIFGNFFIKNFFLIKFHIALMK